MKHELLRRTAAALLLGAGLLLGSCDGSSSGGVGLSVGLPTNYGSMELGMATTNWVGGPLW